MKRLNKHWHTIKIVMINWLIFTALVVSFTMYMLLKDIKDKQQTIQEMSMEIQTLRHNFEEIEKQFPTSEVILKLK
jgi:F0F1-type ATP synthase membrane subunit b/b'